MQNPVDENLDITETDENVHPGTEAKSVIACPQCSQKLRIPGEHREMRLRCRACGEIFNFDGRVDRCDETHPPKRTVLSVIGRVLGIGFIVLGALLGALVLSWILVLLCAWIYASIFNHGQMVSDQTLLKICFPIWILIALFAFGGREGGREMLLIVIALYCGFARVLRRAFGSNRIPTEGSTTATPSQDAASKPTGIGGNIGKQDVGSFKAFFLGMALGLAAYAFYLKFLTADEPTALCVGWIFFIPQYLVSWVGSLLNASPIATLVASCLSIMLFYGYVCISIRLAPRLALGTVLVSSVLFLALVYWQHVDGVFMSLARAAFWPAILLREEFDYIGFSNHLVRVLIECVTVAFWHAGLISGTRAFLMLVRRTGGSASVHGH